MEFEAAPFTIYKVLGSNEKERKKEKGRRRKEESKEWRNRGRCLIRLVSG